MMMKSMIAALLMSVISIHAFAQDNLADGTVDPSGTEASEAGKSANPGTKIIPSSTAAGVSTSTLGTDAPLRSRVTFTYLNETLVGKSSLANGSPEASGINRLQLGYKLSDTKAFSVREDTSFSIPSNKRAEFKFTDPFIAYTDAKFATLPADWVVTVQPRLYMPFGEDTINKTKGLGGASLWFLLDKSVGKWDFEFVTMAQTYFQRQDYYGTTDDTGASKNVATRDWVAYPAYFEVGYNINEKFAVLHDIGIIYEAGHSGPAIDYSRKNTLYQETYLSYAPSKSVKLMASVENDAVFESNNHVNLYQDADMSYNFYLQLKL